MFNGQIICDIIDKIPDCIQKKDSDKKMDISISRWGSTKIGWNKENRTIYNCSLESNGHLFVWVEEMWILSL